MGATSPDRVSTDPSTYSINLTCLLHILYSRLRTILDCTGPNNRYALSRVPRDCTWPVGSGSSKLALKGVPVTVIVVGTVRSFSLEVDADADECNATVSLDLLRDVDRAAHTRLQTAHHHASGTRLHLSEPTKTDTDTGQEHDYVVAQTSCKGAQKVSTLRDTRTQN